MHVVLLGIGAASPNHPSDAAALSPSQSTKHFPREWCKDPAMGGRVRVRMKDEAGQPVSEVLTSSEDTARPQPAHRDYLAECDLCTS